ncbi:DUF4012 domain-containing protein [Demequina sp.]|uniref:DUF4012 domain-containing protein n=1 Tax=Demequina sp. TaxID=2050685 RepID=UPI0025CFE11B|nr:DUF4012 domain-containing protein [Demequina sp.]
MAAVIVAILAFVVAFVWDGVHLQSAAADLKSDARIVQEAVDARDSSALRAGVQDLEQSAQRFAGATDGPHWWLAAHTPWVSQQARPLRQAGASIRAIARDALAPLAALDSLDALEPPRFEDGRIDPYVLEPFRPALEQAAATLTAESAALDAMDLTGTFEQVATPFVELSEEISSLATTVQDAHVAAELLPAMLGAEAPRNYLVVVQNNAEPRATGGIAGAVIEVTVDDGRMTLGRYVPAYTLTDREAPPALTEDEERIFSRRMAIYPQDANFTPEFPRTGEILSEQWTAKTGDVADGVLSIDPVALGWMLEGAPAMTIDGFDIDGDNLAQVMMSDAYAAFATPDEQDAFFARASSVLFGELVSGEASTLGGVERAVDAGRLLLWADDAGEQDLLATTAIAGDFVGRDRALGIFSNDGSGSKIGYYVDTAVEITDHFCADGSLEGQTVALTLTHSYEGDVADLPDYVAVGGGFVPPGEFQTNVLVYPPVGVGIEALTVDGEEGLFAADSHHGRGVAQLRVTLDPGQSTLLEWDLVADSYLRTPPDLVLTPGPREADVTRASDTAGVAGC